MPLIIDGNKQVNTSVLDIFNALQQQLYVSKIDKLNKSVLKSDNLMVQCPVHSDGHEKTPSCNILLHDRTRLHNGREEVVPAGTVNCFACGYKANLVKFIANCLNISYRKATSWLVNIVDYDLVENVRDVDFTFEDSLTNNNYSSLPIITEDDLKKYDYIHPYMFKRHLTPEVIEQFDVGYSPEDDALTFPVYVNGKCLFVAKRKVSFKRFIMPKVEPKPIYALDYIDPTKDVYVCESVINALTLYTFGLQAIALFGTGSEYQISQLNKSSIRRFIICLDGDNAGKYGTKKLINGLTNKIVLYKEMPDGKDINDLTKEEFFSIQENF